jgi:hypothetical protein
MVIGTHFQLINSRINDDAGRINRYPLLALAGQAGSQTDSYTGRKPSQVRQRKCNDKYKDYNAHFMWWFGCVGYLCSHPVKAVL